MKQAIQCKYSCFKCGIIKRVITVPSREEEDVKTWMDATALLISRDHDRHSPGCVITKLDEVWIPVEGAEKIGGLPK